MFFFNGVKHIRFKPDYTGGFYEQIYFIEGIGANWWSMIPPESPSYVHCFQNQTFFYKNTLKSRYGFENCYCGSFFSTAITKVKNNDYKIFNIDNRLVVNFVEKSDVNISIFGIDGRLFYNNNFFDKEIIISTENFPKGVYLIKIFNTNTYFTDKIII
ncbi:MAG: T9SS type A sorting domain-containing protein [Prevotellaceae bacterium]|nr:T9SS type A sorting domain-containing protein [Prevotellaceae bacterium]